MQEHAQTAKEIFSQGYNCAQAVVLAFADELGLDRTAATRISSSFGAGMGRLREVCGALSGVFMVAGLLYGYEDPGDSKAKAAHYARIQELAAAFREQHGTLVCRQLLGKPKGADSPTPEQRTPAYYDSRPCPQIVYDAVAILDNYIKEHPPECHP